MTVSSQTNRISYTGNGTTTAFAFPYEFDAGSDLKVYKAGTLQTITTHYTVSGGSGSSGTVTFVTAPANADSIVIYDDPPATQLLDYIANDPFPAETHEGGLDKLTRLVRRLKDLVNRSFRLPDSYAGSASTELPTPEADKFLTWNSAATALVNRTASDLVTLTAFAAWTSQRFSGNGVTTQFTLSSDPGNVNNMDVSISGVTQQNGVDFTVSGTTMTFTSAPPSGTNNIFVRWGQALPESTSTLQARLADPASASNGAGMIARNAQLVNSIAALKALNKNAESKYANVTGYYAAGDGGGGLYYYDSADTTTADNGGTVIVASDGGRWKLADTKTVTLEQFGGGSARSTSENATAANQACKWCFDSGSTLRLKPVTYAGARIEVHGTFNIEGNGATVDYLGVGYTIIAGTGSGTSAVPTAWSTDPDIYNSAAYVPTMYSIASPVAIGDDSITLGGVAGLAAGDTVFVAGNPTSASSVNNYIPASCEFAQVLSIVGNVVTLNGKARNTYTTAGAVFKCPGLAKGGTISDLRLKSTASEAYQAVVRSALDVTIRNIEFAGRDTLGGATFSEALRLENWRSTGAGGNWSFARATISAYLDGLLFQYRSGLTSEPNAIFVEESCYDVTVARVRGYGASFSVRQMDMAGAIIKRSITILDSVFDTSNSPGGATAPFQCGTASGVDIDAIGCTFAGAVSTPNASSYPGVTGTALMWITGNQTTDRVKFSACHIKASTSGAAFKNGSGALGSVLFDDACTYETVTPPVRDYTPLSAWVDMASGLLNGITVTSGFSAKYRSTPWDVTFSARVDLNGAATGTNFFLMPAGSRPATEKRFVVGTNLTNIWATVRVTSDGDVFYVGSTGAPSYLDLAISYPLDV